MKKFGIVGAGLLGRMAAFLLSCSGYKVSIFEQTSPNPKIGERRAAAFTSAGMLSPISEKEYGGEILSDLGKRSIYLWPIIENLVKKKLGQGIGLKVIGNIFVSQPQDISYTERLFKKISFNEKPLSREIFQNLEPSLDSNLKCWLVKNEGQLDPLLAMDNFYKASFFSKNGSVTQWNFFSEVQSIEDSTIYVNDHKFKFDMIFDFRGTGARDLKVRGVRGEVLLLKPPNNFILHRPVRLIHPRIKAYIVPKSSGELVIGATEIESEETSPISVRSILELLTATQSIMPELIEARVISGDVNLRPATDDNLPLIMLENSVYRVNGLFRHGWLIAPAILEKIFCDLNLKTAISTSNKISFYENQS